MKLYLMYALIIVISIVIITLLKDRQKALSLLGKITIITSIVMSVILIIINIILKNNINFINIRVFLNYISKEYMLNILYLYILGILELTISKYLSKRKKL